MTSTLSGLVFISFESLCRVDETQMSEDFLPSHSGSLPLPDSPRSWFLDRPLSSRV